MHRATNPSRASPARLASHVRRAPRAPGINRVTSASRSSAPTAQRLRRHRARPPHHTERPTSKSNEPTAPGLLRIQMNPNEPHRTNTATSACEPRSHQHRKCACSRLRPNTTLSTVDTRNATVCTVYGTLRERAVSCAPRQRAVTGPAHSDHVPSGSRSLGT